jgi:hypothetical protein
MTSKNSIDLIFAEAKIRNSIARQHDNAKYIEFIQ